MTTLGKVKSQWHLKWLSAGMRGGTLTQESYVLLNIWSQPFRWNGNHQRALSKDGS